MAVNSKVSKAHPSTPTPKWVEELIEQVGIRRLQRTKDFLRVLSEHSDEILNEAANESDES